MRPARCVRHPRGLTQQELPQRSRRVGPVAGDGQATAWRLPGNQVGVVGVVKRPESGRPAPGLGSHRESSQAGAAGASALVGAPTQLCFCNAWGDQLTIHQGMAACARVCCARLCTCVLPIVPSRWVVFRHGTCNTALFLHRRLLFAVRSPVCVLLLYSLLRSLYPLSLIFAAAFSRTACTEEHDNCMGRKFSMLNIQCAPLGSAGGPVADTCAYMCSPALGLHVSLHRHMLLGVAHEFRS